MHSSSFTSLLCPKRFALAVFGSLVLLLAGAAQAQTTFDWFDTAPDANWKQGAFGARWTGGLFDQPGFGILRFNNNHQLNMTNNVAGTYNMHGLNFGSFNTSTRTLGGNTVRLFDFSGADPHITNDSSATHIINLNLEGDGDGGDPLKINLNSSGGLTFGGTINNQGSWVDVVGTTSSSVSATFNGVISGGGGFYKNNANTTAVLAADNTYSGATTIDAGTLQVGNGGTTGSLGSGNVTNNGTLAFNRSGNFALSNAIGGTGAVQQNGSNVITIGSANSYSGTTTINSGALRVTANDALGTSAGGTVVNNGGQLRLAGVSYTTSEALSINGTGDGNGALYSVSGANSYAGPITVASHATIKNNSTSPLDLNGGIVKNGTTLTLTGTGLFNINNTGISGSAANSDLIVDGTSVTLNATSTYNGPTYIRNAGTLIPAVANALPTSPRSALILDDIGTGNSTLGVNASVAVASLSGEASSMVNSLVGTTLTLGSSSGTTTFAGPLTLTGNLVKDGASTQVFSGNSFSSGSTTVDAGVLELNNNPSGSATGSGQVTVSSGGTLSGTGRIATGFANGVLVNGTFIAGSTIGGPAVESFEIDTSGSSGSTVFGNNSTLMFDLFSRGGDLTGNASAADSLLVTGSLSLLSNVVLDIANAAGLSGWAAGDKWNLWDVSGSTTGTIATINAPALGNPLLNWKFTEGTGVLEIISVPEPSRVLLMMFGLFGLGFRRRRA